MGYRSRAVPLSVTPNKLDSKAHVPLKVAVHLTSIPGFMEDIFVCGLIGSTEVDISDYASISNHIKNPEKDANCEQSDLNHNRPQRTGYFFTLNGHLLILLAF